MGHVEGPRREQIDWGQELCDNLNRNLAAQAVLDEMAQRQGLDYGPELASRMTPEFVARFNVAYDACVAAGKPGPLEEFVARFVDAWPLLAAAMHFSGEARTLMCRPPFTVNGRWPAYLAPRSELTD